MSDIKPIAFYLPQFHPVQENSAWWGPGFTEWTNVAKAKPNFVGHYQPHIPRELGFYDLRLVEVMRQQAGLARLYGIYGFCFYYYWFSGRRILELPLDNYLKSDIDFPFCVCWANENWTRTWDGLNKHVLLEQKHEENEGRRFLEDLLPLLKDRRAIKVDGKPLLLVYRINLLPNAVATTKLWRRLAEENGLPGLHLCAVQFYGLSDPREWGCDAAVEFPPHTFIEPENAPTTLPEITNDKFVGHLSDYARIIARSIERTSCDYRWYRGVVPSWDNTARRQNNSFALLNSSPSLYQYWLRYLVEFTRGAHEEAHRFIFINAWNEWGEGCHLEPDLKYGLAYLEATLAALQGTDAANKLLLSEPELLRLVGKEGIKSLLNDKDAQEKILIQLAAEVRYSKRTVSASVIRKLKNIIAHQLLPYPRLYRAAHRFYNSFK